MAVDVSRQAGTRRVSGTRKGLVLGTGTGTFSWEPGVRFSRSVELEPGESVPQALPAFEFGVTYIFPSTEGTFSVDVEPTVILDDEPQAWTRPTTMVNWESWNRWSQLLGEAEDTMVIRANVPRIRFLTEPTAHDSLLAALRLLQQASPSDGRLLETLLRLEPKWDGSQASPPTAIAVETAAQLIWRVLQYSHGKTATSFVAPTPEGGIEIGWEGLGGNELLLVIPPSGTGIRYVKSQRTEKAGYQDMAGELEEKKPTLESIVHEFAI